jgi:membrane protein implicated in regulation of membrane protease activity
MLHTANGTSWAAQTATWREYDEPTSTLGFVSVAIAFVLLIAEAHLSTGGIIAIGAAVALVGGIALLLAGSGASAIAVVAAAAGVCLASVASVLLLRRTFSSVRRLRPRSGTEAMVGHVGVVRVGDAAARVFVDGGLWRAQPSALEEGRALHDGDRVVVERVNGLTLSVRKAEEWELNP